MCCAGMWQGACAHCWSPHADCLLPTATLSSPMAVPSVLASPVGVRDVAPSSATTAVSPGTLMGPVHRHC